MLFFCWFFHPKIARLRFDYLNLHFNGYCRKKQVQGGEQTALRQLILFNLLEASKFSNVKGIPAIH